MLLLIVLGGTLGDAIARRAHIGGAFTWIWNIARWPIAFAAVLLFFALIYYLAPNDEQRSWRWMTPGSVAGGLIVDRAQRPVRALHRVLQLVHEDVRDARRRNHPPAVAELLRVGGPLRRRAESELDRQADIHAAGGEHAGLIKPARRR